MSNRLHSYHGRKKEIIGNRAARVAPAWREQATTGGGAKVQNGARHASGAQKQHAPASRMATTSKILMSDLPKDVGKDEVEELLNKTIGPVTDVFIVYNSQGLSKGMAVATFARPGDAALARQKYHGKIVDGKTPLKIEIVVNDVVASPVAPVAAPAGRPLTLADRVTARPAAPVPLKDRVGPKIVPTGKGKASPSAPARPAPAKRTRTKKGPKRLKKAATKRHPATALELDEQLDGYRAQMDVAAT